MFEGALDAVSHVVTWQAVFLLVFATSVGTAAAILPGVSPGTMMALLLPFTFGMDRYEAFMFLTALMAAGGFAGSMTSILLNVPGDGINAATCLDGFPLARQGKAGVAIGASAAASGLGALFGLVLLVLSLPFIRSAILLFGPPEFMALSVAGVSLIASISTRSPLKGVIAGLIGMVIGFIGVNYTVGGVRYTFGLPEMEDGIQLVPALIGLFALPELFNLLRHDQAVSQVGYTVKGGVWQGVLEVLRRPVLFFRSAAIGTTIGIIPGVGGSVASWVAYFTALNASKDPESFGKGNVEGVIAPEAAIDAKEGGSMMPALALGLPGSVSTAILLSAFQIHGVFPGQRLFQQDMALVWVMILAMVFSNLTTSALGLTFANSMVKLTLVPATIMAPIILVLGAVGSYADQQSLFGILLMLVFGVVGLLMVRLGYPRPPLLVGMILLPLAEENFHLSLQIYRGSYEFLLRPLTLVILIVTVLALATPLLRRLWARRRGATASVAAAIQTAGPQQQPDAAADAPRRPSWVDPVFALGLLAFAALFLLLSFQFPARARVFPQIVLVPLVALVGWLIVRTLAQLRAQQGIARERDVTARSDWLIFAWVLALPVLIWVIGVLPAAGIYTAAFLIAFVPRRLTLRRTLLAAVAGGVVAGLMYAVFVRGLAIRFYEGILG